MWLMENFDLDSRTWGPSSISQEKALATDT